MSDDGANAINLDSGNEDEEVLGATEAAGEGEGEAVGKGAAEAPSAPAAEAATAEATTAGDEAKDEDKAQGGDAGMVAELEELDAALTKMAEQTQNILSEGVEEAAGALNQHGFNDANSVYVGNVDYNTTPPQLHELFESCGLVNRITIPVNRYKQAKGCVHRCGLLGRCVVVSVCASASNVCGGPPHVPPHRAGSPTSSSWTRKPWKTRWC
mgnify:CR=1 FL=1